LTGGVSPSGYSEDAGGNHERIAFVYDTRAAVFTGLASNIYPPRKKDGAEYVASPSWWRQPYLGSFRAGSFDFVLLAAHVRWGDSEAQRLPELTLLADWVDRRVKAVSAVDKDLIVVGDFNIPDTDSDLYKAVTSKGLKMPKALMGLHGSNLAKDKRYDQILHREEFTKSFTGNGGVLDFYAGDHKPLAPAGMKLEDWTFQLSYHLPLWIQLNTNNADEKLDQILNPKPK
jgi:hypothetical protein